MAFPKGKSGNPLGRRLEQQRGDFSGAIRRAILQNDGQTLRKIADTLITIATTGEKDSDRVSAIKEIADRVEGKVPQAITGPDGGPVQVQDVPWLRGRGVTSR